MRPRLAPRIGLLALVALLALPALAQASEVAPCGKRLCVEVQQRPGGVVSPSTSAEASHVAYDVTIESQTTATSTHVRLTDTLAGGGRLVGPTSGCTVAGAVTCEIGTMAAGAVVRLTILAQAPASDATLTNTVTVSFDEGPSDNDGGKTDTVTAATSTTVRTLLGQVSTFVLPGETVDLTTDPTTSVATSDARRNQIAGVHIPPLAFGVAASLARTGDTSCPGSICTLGDWVRASVPYQSTANPLRFTLRTDASLIQSRQNRNSIVVYHQLDSGGLEVVSQRCSSPTGPLGPGGSPCIFVTKERDGDFTVVLVTSHNGRIRM
jgi:hypothetical protein